NPRYLWLGERSIARARRLISRCRLLALTSRSEGGANVISEAIASGVPVVASRIDCTVGLLGADYPGLFPVGRTAALRALLLRAEREPPFLQDLAARCRRLRPRLSPRSERRAWKSSLAELGREIGRETVRPPRRRAEASIRSSRRRARLRA